MTANLDNQDETRMTLTSADVTKERLEKLKDLYPDTFAEGKVDFERLRQALGNVVDTGRERYGLSWAGKADAAFPGLLLAIPLSSGSPLSPARLGSRRLLRALRQLVLP